MPISEKDFNFWMEQQRYVATARLHSWPESWHNLRNLRFFGSVSWVAAVPHDIEGRVRIEALHESITKHEFFDPFVYENRVSPKSGRKSIYVSLIPLPVVDWFSKHTIEEIHDQIATYLALFYIEEKFSNPYIIKDTHSSYHSAIEHHLSNFKSKYPELNKDCIPMGPHDLFERDNYEIKDVNTLFQCKTEIEMKWRRDNESEAQIYDEKLAIYWDAEIALLKELYKSRKLPGWFLKIIELKSSDGKVLEYFNLPKLRHDEDFGWSRPTGALVDDFGIVSYGLTSVDELRLSGKKIEYDSNTGEETIKKLTTKELEDARTDELSRTESNSTAFDFLMYAKSKGKEWPNWAISHPKHNGYIYLLSDGEAVKIGFSCEHPAKAARKSVLQTGNSRKLELIGYIEGTREKEKILHKKYAHKKTIGEWFDLDMAEIKNILSAGIILI